VSNDESAGIFTSSVGKELKDVSAAANTLEDKSEEAQPSLHQTHQETRSGNIIAPYGSNSSITINNHYHRIVRDAEQWHLDDGENENNEKAKKTSDTEKDFITENLRFGLQNIPQFDDSKTYVPTTSHTVLENEVQISHWYHVLLDEYEQCYVQSVAILHGALAQEIYQRTDVFYRIMQEQKHVPFQQSTFQQNTSSETGIKEVQSFIFPRKPRLTLQEKTYTTTRRVNSAERLFWEDVDSNGQSSFGVRVLTFLSKEFLSKGEHWQNFLDTIQKWSSQRDECSWRSARALGIILWHQDVAQLRRQAEIWAKKDSISGRRLAASLLDGAREIEAITLQEAASNRYSSFVLQLLYEWTANFQEKATRTTISVGCATANSYGFIGKKSLDTQSALQGIDSLLAFQQMEVRSDTRALFAAGVSAYVNLTWAGHLRAVIKYLATIVEELVHNWQLPKSLKERHLYRLRHEARLKASFEAFFLVTAAVSPKEQNGNSEIYTQPLADQIDVPDPEKRDSIFVAILTGDTMQIPVCNIVCAAIISNIEQSRKLTFELLRQWIETILTLQDDSNISSKLLYQTFIQFLVNIGKKIDVWCHNLVQRGYRSSASYEVYLHKLGQWQREGSAHKGAIGIFMQEVLYQCKMHSAS
jgi:hypothetical protein